MAKRFSDSEKWNDNFFTSLTNDEKVIWFYLLDHCDNAGIFKINIKNINFFCSTNITVEELFILFKDRLTQIGPDTCIINKFCLFQYGPEFLLSKNKAVVSALNKLLFYGIVENVNGNFQISNQFMNKGINSISIPYQYCIDSPIEPPKEKEEDKDEEEVMDNDKLKEELKEKIIEIFKDEKVIKMIERRDMDAIERMDKYNFNLHYGTIAKYINLK